MLNEALLFLGSVDVGWSVVRAECERTPANPTHVTADRLTKSQTSFFPHSPLQATRIDIRSKGSYPGAPCFMEITRLTPFNPIVADISIRSQPSISSAFSFVLPPNAAFS
jgi:hypothetical protein